MTNSKAPEGRMVIESRGRKMSTTLSVPKDLAIIK
jgi:hypothetical protein